MNIAVDGLRTSAGDWEAVRNIPREQLPPLNERQREVARKLKISEEDYARSALAGERTRGILFAKTEKLARFLEKEIGKLRPEAKLVQITLRTLDHRFDVEIQEDQAVIPLRISEDLIDDLFESGSAEAEQRLTRILNIAFQVREHQ